MRREDVIDLIGRIPESDHPKIQILLRTGMTITTDAFVRFEDLFLVVRGRETGQTEDGRGFFVPYEEIQCLKIDREVSLAELAALFGDEPQAAGQPQPPAVTPAPVATPAPAAPLDPTEIARRNLLERLRAARTAATAPRNGGR
jgi:hypothetical protein